MVGNKKFSEMPDSIVTEDVTGVNAGIYTACCMCKKVCVYVQCVCKHMYVCVWGVCLGFT